MLPPATAAAAPVACPAASIDEFAAVRYVHDGDTVHLADGRKLRLIGINTPELATEDRPAEELAEPARDALRGALRIRGMRVGLVYGRQREDRYGRTLAHLFDARGGNLQAELLQRGLAAALTIAPNDAFSDCYQRAEQVARCARAGLWSLPGFAFAPTAGLQKGTRGFRLISAEVEHVEHNAKGLQLWLSGGVLVNIREADLNHFDKHRLLNLKGQAIGARGWLKPKNKTGKRRDGRSARFTMRIRHPAALEIRTAGQAGKC